MTDVSRVAEVLERARRRSAMCIWRGSARWRCPLTMIGRESLPAGAADAELLLEAEALAALAMEEYGPQ
jgi:ATP-dependent Lhr-like helicase